MQKNKFSKFLRNIKRIKNFKRKIAIIGGGFAGISAAIHSVNRGFSVTLFEAGHHLGGRAKSLNPQKIQIPPVPPPPNANTKNSWAMDNGQHILLGAYSQTFRLLDLLEIDIDKTLTKLPFALISADSGVAMHLENHSENNKKISARQAYKLKLQMLQNAIGINDVEKSLFQKYLQKIKTKSLLKKFKIFNFFLKNKYPTVYENLLPHFQNNENCNVLRYILFPLCLASMNTHPLDADSDVFDNVLANSFCNFSDKNSCDILIPKTGLSDLFAEPAHFWLEQNDAQIFTRCRIGNIAYEKNNGWFLSNADGTFPEYFDSVIIATSPHHCLDLLNNSEIAVNFDDQNLSSEAVGTLYFSFNRCLNFPDALIYLEQPFPSWLIHHGEANYSVVFSGSGAWQSAWNDNLENLRSSYIEKLLQMHKNSLPKDSADRKKLPYLEFQRAVHMPRATLSCRKENTKLFSNILAKSKQKMPLKNLYFCGDYVYTAFPNTLESAIRSGIEVAKKI